MIKKIFIIVFVVFFIVVLIANVIVSKSLTRMINSSIAEQLKKDTGADLKVKKVKINLFRGLLSVSEIEAATPPVFDEETVLSVGACRVNVGLLSLLKGVINISEAAVENSIITIARIKGSQLNVPLPLIMPASTPSEKPEDLVGVISEEPVATQSVELPKMKVNNVSLQTVLNYIDYDVGTEPLHIGLNIALEADGIKTYGAIGPEADWGTFKLTTALKDNPEKFVSEIKGQLAPVTDPMMASFNIDATIKNVDLREIQQVADELGITSSDVSIEAHLKCRNGVFDRVNSKVKLICIDPKPAGKHADKAQYMSPIKKIELPINVGGTLEKIDIGNWEEIVITALLANFSNVAIPVLEKLNKESSEIDGAKIEKEVNRGLRKLGLDKLFK